MSSTTSKSSINYADLHEAPNVVGVEQGDQKDCTSLQILAHIPDSVIDFSHHAEMPATKEFIGVTLFADISGFTALTEKYSNLQTEDGTSGTDKLSATLNAYIGKIAHEIIENGGDIIKFAGDAILATWKCSDVGHDVKIILTKVINCSLDIQRECHNFMTEVGVMLRVKLAIAVGPMCLTFVGVTSSKQFDLSGGAIDDVGKTEKSATPGAIILSQLAWANCNQSLFCSQPIENGKFFKILTDAPNQISCDPANKELDGKPNKMVAKLNKSEKVVTCPILDDLIDQVVDFRTDMPKALMAVEDSKQRDEALVHTIAIKEGESSTPRKKEKKFDRRTMTVNLTATELHHLRAYVAEPVLQKIDNGQDLNWLSEMRQVSVLFINMKLPDGTNKASEALQKAFEVVYEACLKFKGSVNKVFGFDKGCTFVLIFGLPGQKHEDDATRALKCAYYIFESLHAISDIANESIGVTTGLAFCGVVGHKDRHEYTVIGSKVNMAARLMMYYPGILTCDADTYEAAKGRLKKQDFYTMPYVEMKGMKDPGVVREYNPSSSKQDKDRDCHFPILGREADLLSFRLALDVMKSHTATPSQVLVIEGELGIGKTRFLEEIMDFAESIGLRVLNIDVDIGRAQSQQSLLSHITKGILGLREVQTTHELEMRLLEIFEDTSRNSDLAIFNKIIGTHFISSSSTQDVSEQSWRTRTLSILSIAANRVCTKRPCLVCIDNPAHIEKTCWDFIRALTSVSGCALAIAVRTHQPDLCDVARSIIDSPRRVYVELGGLPPEVMGDLACQMLEVDEIPRKLHDIITDKSQGVPSWCQQLVKDLVYSNMIQVVSKSSVKTQRMSIGAATKPLLAPHHMDEDTERDPILTEASQQGRRLRSGSSTPGKNLRFDKLTPGSDTGPSRKERRPSSATPSRNGGGAQMAYDPQNSFKASPGVIPFECDDICIVAPGIELTEVVVPNSVKDIVVARMDRMTLNEQTIVKCASVLGLSFSRDLLKAVIPQNCLNLLDTTLYNLAKEKVLECASLVDPSCQGNEGLRQGVSDGELMSKAAHRRHNQGFQKKSNSQVLCGCHAYEGYTTINLSQPTPFSDNKKRVCMFFNFSNNFVQEAAYALWLEDQRKALLEKAAMFLERQTHKCRPCGGSGLNGNRGSFSGTTVAKTSGRRPSSVLFRRHSMPSKRLSSAENGRYVSSAMVSQTKVEHEKFLKQFDSPHLKNYKVKGSRGEENGKMLIEMAQLIAAEKVDDDKKRSRFGRMSRNRVHPNSVVGKLATRALLADFRKSVVLSGQNQSDRKVRTTENSIVDTCKIDLSQCQCNAVHAHVYSLLVHYWRGAGNTTKTFEYLHEAALAWLNMGNNIEAFEHIKEIEKMIADKGENGTMELIMTDEERAKLEIYKGQVLCNMDQLDEGMTHYFNALKLLGSPQPQSKFSITTRIWKATLVQTLHRKMPGVFISNKCDETERLAEQVRCLSLLSVAYFQQNEGRLGYLACLEQLNAAEEAKDYWSELMLAYTNMVMCCHRMRKYEVAKVYEELALSLSSFATVDVLDMLAVGQLHCASLSFRLTSGRLNDAISSGFHAGKIAQSLNDMRLRVSYIPLLVQALILKDRIQSCADLLSELRKAADTLDDSDGLTWYYTCCMDVAFASGKWIEQFSECSAFAAAYSQNPSVPSNDLGLYCLLSNIALWLAFTKKWDIADEFQSLLQTLSPTVSDRYMYLRALVRQTEFALMTFHQFGGKDNLQLCSSKLSTLKGESAGDSIFQPQICHLHAYLSYLKGKSVRARMLLEDCLVACKLADIVLEAEASNNSRNTWFQSTPDEGVNRPLKLYYPKVE